MYISDNGKTYYVFTIQNNISNSILFNINYFRFNSWIDMADTSPESFEKFYGQIMDFIDKEDQYILVHCSAGVGRTGTFIVFDLMRRLISSKPNKKIIFKEKDFDEVRQKIRLIRGNNYMVQTKIK